jgi:uncharacterized protein YdaU (DUF1376 family)
MLSAKIRHADFYPDEFLVGVVGLGPAEIGALWVACALMYSKGGPIADDDAWIARACGCHVRSWRALKERLLATGKLTLGDGLLRNSRVLREIGRAQRRMNLSRRACEASVEARRERFETEGESRQDKGLAEASAATDREPSPTTNHHPTNPQPSGDAERMAFDAFVAACHRHKWPVPGHLSEPRRKALRARARDAGGLDALLAVIERAEQSKFIREEMSGWCLDWFLKPSNFEKVRDGNYDRSRVASQEEAARQPMQI